MRKRACRLLIQVLHVILKAYFLNIMSARSFVLLFDLILSPINNLSVIKGLDFLG